MARLISAARNMRRLRAVITDAAAEAHQQRWACLNKALAAISERSVARVEGRTLGVVPFPGDDAEA